LLNSSGDFMKKYTEVGQKKTSDDDALAGSEEQSAKRQKVTDELRYGLRAHEIRHPMMWQFKVTVTVVTVVT